MKLNYGIERRLAQCGPELHRRYRDCVVISQRMLCRYENYFPDFTDHTVLHTLDILELCNQLIGDQIEKLTAQDLYVLLMGALFHDVGMGGSRRTLMSSGRCWAFQNRRMIPPGPEPSGITTRSCPACIWKSIGLCWISPMRPMPGRSSRSAGAIGKQTCWTRRAIRPNLRWSRARR